MNMTFLYLGLVGLFLVLFSVFKIRKKIKYERNGIKTSATVIAVEEVVNIRRMERRFYPVVKFMLRNGDWFKGKYSDGSLPASYKIGDNVDIVYIEEKPEAYIITQQNWKSLIFLVIGLVLLGYCAVSYFIK